MAGQSSDQKKKAIFNKIRSNVERRDAFLKMILQKQNFICKGDGPSLCHFIPDYLKDNNAIVGTVVNIEGYVRHGEHIIANWNVGDDRYFMQTTLAQIDLREALLVPDEIYKLQRRAHNRVELPKDIGREVAITEINNIKLHIDAECLDISEGGARLAILGLNSTVKMNNHLKAMFSIRKKWAFEAACIVKHVKEEDGFQMLGVEFDRDNKALQNRLHMMMLELQRWAVQTHGKSY